MSLKTQRFRFGEFFLDGEEKILLRNGLPVSITPKAFELLLVLVQNHGHLVKKEELIKAIWKGSFVEEGNLAYTMRLLRKVLEDDSNNLKAIETVPRRGYRFIAEVFEVSSESEQSNQIEQRYFLIKENWFVTHPRFKNFLIPIAIVVIVLLGGGFWLVRTQNTSYGAPILSEPFLLERLTDSGNAMLAVVSPDSRNVFYSNSSGGKSSIWLRQLDSLSNVEIIPPSKDFYGGLSLSPDGNILYFARLSESVEGQLDIYRVSIFGGVPLKIIKETQGWISISPDGAKISFVRCYYRDDEFCSLWIANSLDGKYEEKLVSRSRPYRIGDNRISPDGKSIAFAVGQSENQGNDFVLAEVRIDNRKERKLTEEKFFNIKNLVWLPNGNNLLMTASRIPNKNFLIWQVSRNSGEIKPLTKDSETYSSLSLDEAGRTLISTQVKRDFQIQVFQMDNSSVKSFLTDGESVEFAPNGNILFSSATTGNDEIWSINSDGNNRKQLTNDKSGDTRPVSSPDGNTIYFSSNRSGEVQVWRMDSDGGNQTQLTLKNGGFPISVSSDGNWVYYHHGLDRTLWRVLNNGSNQEKVFGIPKYRFAVSPDGSQAAFLEKRGAEKFIVTAFLNDHRPDKIFKLAGNANLAYITWSQDGKKFFYILDRGYSENKTLWMQPIGNEKAIFVAYLGDQATSETKGFAVSSDGKLFAVAQGRWKHDAVLFRGLK